jgi:3-hydroxymyristoyl/3-hydroxydecanoyl-(acyl carrier protein) dehydratase
MDPRQFVPQRPPFLFLDEIEELSAVAGRARYRFKPDEWFFAGHFPGNPVVPGVIQIEAMAQLMVAVGVFAARESGQTVNQVWFTLVDQCRFHRPLGPGDEVLVGVTMEWMRLKTVQVQAKLSHAVSGELVSEAVLRGATR